MCLAVLLAVAGGCSGGQPSATARPPSQSVTGGVTDIDLAAASGLRKVILPDPGDVGNGNASLATGDFNGDGIPDLLIGAPFADGPDNSRTDAGEAFVIFGSSDLADQIDLAEDTPGLRVLGAQPGDNLGFAVAAGDLNGDGIDDVIAGAPGSNTLENIRTDLGEAYVVFGRHDLDGAVDTLQNQQDFTLAAAEGFARLGSSFAVADVNSDGIEDLIAGAPFGGRQPHTPPGGPRTTVGEVYVVFGSAGLKGERSVARDDQDVLLSGMREHDRFGQAVGVGDVNGDGVADIVVGAPGLDAADGPREDAGGVFVFMGSPSLSGRRGIDSADTTILGAAPRDGFGSLVALGDVDGDGRPDIIAAASTANGPGGRRPASGQVYVIRGDDSPAKGIDLASQEAYAVVYPPSAQGLVPGAMAVGDVDGDGRSDVILGAPLISGYGRSSNGAAYLVYGRGLRGEVDLQLASDAVFVYGGEDNDALGTSVAIADLDHDGQPEIAVEASGAGGAGSPAARGAIYLLTGGFR